MLCLKFQTQHIDKHMNNRSKAKTIAPTDETLPIDLPAPEISEDLAQDPNIAPLLDPPAPPSSSLLQSAIDQQEKELTDLQSQMDRLSDQYATRARSIVLQGLEDGRRKARAQILTIDIPAFFASEGNGSPLPSVPNPIALPQSIEGGSA
jgi:hypothetical protein